MSPSDSALVPRFRPSSALACHWIGGRWVDSGVRADSFNPATGEVIGQYVKAGATEAQQAVDIANRVFKESPWRFDRELRARVLNAMADLFQARSEELVEILALENGKIKPEARFEVAMAAPTIRFNAALALTDTGRAAQVSQAAVSMVVRQAAGVAGIIAPWNSPVALALRSLAPALAAGSTTVVNLPGATAQTNARRSRRRLGGKAPMIVFDDADLDVAVEKITQALTVFAGQFCMTGSRLLVQSGVAEQLKTRLADRLAGIKVGPAADPASEMGPIIDRKNVQRIELMVQEAIDAGAIPVVRGGPLTEGPLAAGAFFRPTLLEVTDSSLPIVQQEVFGPVLTMIIFTTESEAVELANDSLYGLSASIFTSNVDVPLRVALQLDCGTVWINHWAVIHNQSEEGGFKGSGQGRMRGHAVMDDFVEYKHIAFAPGTPPRY